MLYILTRTRTTSTLSVVFPVMPYHANPLRTTMLIYSALVFMEAFEVTVQSLGLEMTEDPERNDTRRWILLI